MKAALAILLLSALALPAQAGIPRIPVVKRDVTEKQKQELFKKAGIPKDKQHIYVIDHKIPLELGGTNATSNLQVQDKATAKRKDRVESFLKGEVKAGRMTLAEAQKKILHWETVPVK